MNSLITANGGSVTLLAGGEDNPLTSTEIRGPLESPALTIRPSGTGAIFLPLPTNPPAVVVSGTNNILTAENADIVLNSVPGQGAVILGGNVLINAFGQFRPTSFSNSRDLYSPSGLVSRGFALFTDDLFHGTIGDMGFSMSGGSAVVSAKKSSIVSLGRHRVQLNKGCVALIERLEVDKIKNLSVEPIDVFLFHGGMVKLESSQELIIGESSNVSDGLGRRRETLIKTSTLTASLSEYSIASVLSNHTILRNLRRSSKQSEQALFSLIVKSAAAVSLVTSSHGPFRSR